MKNLNITFKKKKNVSYPFNNFGFDIIIIINIIYFKKDKFGLLTKVSYYRASFSP